MRGIEASLHVWSEVRSGKFASESIRRIAGLLTPGDLTLASSLVYLSLRRQFLWKEISGAFLKTSPRGLSRAAEDALCIGAAGILELRTFAPRVLVNGLVQELKKAGDEKGSRVVNAVLRRVAEEGPARMKKIKESGGLKEQALYFGVPSWVASEWRNAWGDDGKNLLKMMLIRPYSSFRAAPGLKYKNYRLSRRKGNPLLAVAFSNVVPPSSRHRLSAGFPGLQRRDCNCPERVFHDSWRSYKKNVPGRPHPRNVQRPGDKNRPNRIPPSRRAP